MLFDGAFHVPSWLRQLAIGPMDLIVHCRREEGGEYGPPSQGAVALAEWLLADAVRAEKEARRAGSPLSMGGVVTRLLAGSMEPSAPLAESIGRMTGGAVDQAAFERVADGVPAECALAAEPIPELERAAPPAVLGEVPSGPLFEAERDGRVIVVRGLGVTLRTSEAAAKRLRDTLTAAIASAPPGGTPPGLRSAHL